MPNVILESTLDNVDWAKVSALFNAVDWGVRDATLLQQAFTRSSHVRFAYRDNELVGFGRTIDDGQFYATIVDLVVHPDFQDEDIGHTLLNELSTATKGYIITTLTATPGKGGFYEKNGWHHGKTGYVLPRSDKQKADYC